MTKEMKSRDWDELRKIIDDGMEKRDREIYIGFYESETLVTIAPMSTDEEELPETPKNESKKPKNEIIVRVPYSKDAKMEAVCCEEELKRKGVKIERMYSSGICSAVETERHRIVFWPIRNEELKEFVDTHPSVLIVDCFTDILDFLF